MNILKFCTSKDTINRGKSNPQKGKKISANPISNRDQYLEYIERTTKTQQQNNKQPNLKMGKEKKKGKELEQTFLQRRYTNGQ